MSRTRSPGELADVLSTLPVRISALEVRTGAVAVRDYPGGQRPSSVVSVSGAGFSGWGENVAFTAEEHQAFAANVRALLHGGPRDCDVRTALGLAAHLGRYERAAWEAAVIDLAMRQGGVSFGDLTGVGGADIRFVTSFAPTPDPVAHVTRLREEGCTGELKVDVDPAWSEATCVALARQTGIAVLDFKAHHRDEAFARRLSSLFATVLFEDPPPGIVHAHSSRDATLVDAGAVAAAAARGEAVNLKAPRMAGPIELLRGLEACVRLGRHVRGQEVADGAAYVGGMFEVDVGRRQARQLAALYCADGTNDLGPLQSGPPLSGGGATHAAAAVASREGIARMHVRLDTPGFGAVAGQHR